MTKKLHPPRDAALMPIGRYEWERLVRRIVMPKDDKFLAFTMATWADPDGTRVRPGLKWLVASTGDSERTVRRHLAALLRHWGLLELVSRGGGRGGAGRTAEYRLTIPTDLLDRHVLLDPNGQFDSLATQVAGQSEVSPDVQVAGQSDEDADSPATMSGRSNNTQPVDNVDSPGNTVAGESSERGSIDRPPGALSDRLTGQIERLTGHPAWPTTSHSTNHQTRPTLRSPTNATTDRAREPPNDQPANPSSASKCRHGLAAATDANGVPRCPACRRGLPAAATTEGVQS